jgi:hypothetical protein
VCRRDCQRRSCAESGPEHHSIPTEWRRREATTVARSTKEAALREIRRYCDQYPDVAPEVYAVGIMRRAEDRTEHRAVIAALDQVVLEKYS